MRLANDMRERALVLLQISQESVEFKEHAAYAAAMWLTLAALEDRFRPRCSRTPEEAEECASSTSA
jgi:hypothetical protein